ncbi:flagellar basal body L-ring protein FlgH [Legionella nagasakiensis]|uniref:flagellar basal body L-ring protein FlgH n=1 Tax=Legionella nagasakiensis TaxID=535290 RepID=UPI0010562FAD|nr:flagellar basal body L-ring protein FlgH [Legionella nagasakiensis]
MSFKSRSFPGQEKIKYIFALSSLFLAGCEPLFIADVPTPAALPVDVRPPPKKQGTIYQQGFEVQLYEDKVAHRVGDVLTIRLEETTRGESRGKTRTDKRATLDYPIPTFFGKVMPFLEVQTDTQQRFDGRGDSDQSNKLSGTISVTVMQVLPNYSMVVQGESWVTINQSRELIQLTGIVRPEDILPNNIVSSQRVAAAQIKYISRGQAGYARRGGLLTQLFNRYAPY